MTQEGGAVANSIEKPNNFTLKFLRLKQELEELAKKLEEKAKKKEHEEEQEQILAMRNKARELLLKVQEMLKRMRGIYVSVSENVDRKATCSVEVLEKILVNIEEVYKKISLDIALLRIDFNFAAIEELRAKYAVSLGNNSSNDIEQMHGILDVIKLLSKDTTLLKQNMGQDQKQVLEGWGQIDGLFHKLTLLYDNFVQEGVASRENIEMTKTGTLAELQETITVLSKHINEYKKTWWSWCNEMWQDHVRQVDGITTDMDNLAKNTVSFLAKSTGNVTAYSSIFKPPPNTVGGNVSPEYFLKVLGDGSLTALEFLQGHGRN